MDPSSSIQLVLLIILLYFSSFFSSAETALMSLSRIRVRHMVEEDSKNAKIIAGLLESPNKLLSTILVGNNLVNIAASAIATSLALRFLGSGGVAIATGIMTFLVLVFGEITPKSIAVQKSEKVATRIAKPMLFIVKVLSPIVKIFTLITNVTIKLRGGNIHKNEPYITEEELKTIVNVSQEEGVLEIEEKEMIHNVFEFGESIVKEIMIPRTDVIAVNLTISYAELLDIIKEEQFSRIPVFDESPDNIIGILHIKDLFLFASPENFTLRDLLRDPYYVFEFKKVNELFSEMKKDRVHMAIVVDEYGGTAGIITIEDLIEEIVGNIEDEYDDDQEQDVETIKENEYIIDGGYHIDDINEMFNLNLPIDEFDTVAGFMINAIGHIPEENETLEYENLTFKVEQMSKNRIEKIRLVIG